MSTVAEQAFRYLLGANTALAALVSTRIYPQSAPQSAVRPFITFERISADHHHHMTAASGLVKAVIQATAWAEDYSTAKTVAEAMREAADGYRGTITISVGVALTNCHIMISNERDVVEWPQDGSDAPRRGVQIDFDFWHTESVPTFS
jgi:hypothetical protein